MGLSVQETIPLAVTGFKEQSEADPASTRNYRNMGG